MKDHRKTPKFSWSNSRASTFENCPLQYYFQYYGFWGGDRYDASELTKQIWALKQETTVPLWTGDIVHKTIAWHLANYKKTNERENIDILYDVALDLIQQDIQNAKEQKWKAGSFIRIHEIEEHGKLSDKSLEDIDRRVFESLDAYFNSEILDYILSIPTEQWLSIDDLHLIEINGVNVYAAADFAFREDDGTVFIIDWKTGKEKVDSIKQQLLVYADLARRIWDADPEKIKLLGVFLAEKARLSEYDVGSSLDMKEKFDKRIAESVHNMKKMIVNGNINDNIPKSIDCFKRNKGKSCYWCAFKKICNYEMWLT